MSTLFWFFAVVQVGSLPLLTCATLFGDIHSASRLARSSAAAFVEAVQALASCGMLERILPLMPEAVPLVAGVMVSVTPSARGLAVDWGRLDSPLSISLRCLPQVCKLHMPQRLARAVLLDCLPSACGHNQLLKSRGLSLQELDCWLTCYDLLCDAAAQVPLVAAVMTGRIMQDMLHSLQTFEVPGQHAVEVRG